MDKTTDRLERLIERYFEASTSLDEERQLRRLLAQTKQSSPLIDEARAVMGYTAAGRKVKSESLQPSSGNRLLRELRIAASVAIIIGAGTIAVKLSTPKAEASSRCVAYVNEVRITDEDVVREMALNDLRDAVAYTAEVDDYNRQILSELSETYGEIKASVAL